MVRFILLSIFMLALLVDVSAAQTPKPSAKTEAFPKYKLNIEVRPGTHHVGVEGEVRLPAAEGAREELVFALSEMAAGLKVDVLHQASSAGNLKDTACPSIYPRGDAA